ncbi:MAG TPA: VOC family protein [Quisquiliibacterium sp.]|nr:VOC family protein [Quisquiliibacterium sp.]HPA89798.1 VOC family protein [Quisquiliibacterium sp.]HQD83275.1 VOC family protein [Quisquiliibacterium sp.]HQN13441.1 VOC family protein [Quisquiliibacterium sp.]HQP68628.1 VOC family protein [Quisquiliibacterium sp.]
MDLAKPHMDVGLFTNRRDEQLHFWQQTVGLEFDHIGKLGGGMQQLRHHVNGSILKVNHARDPLSPAPPSGILRVRIARPGLAQRRALADPDGNAVLLVPPGDEGVVGIAIELGVNDRDAHDHFWRHVMQFASPRKGVYLCGDTQVMVVETRSVARCDEWRAPGWRYTTVQIRDCVAEHAGVLARGGEEGRPPIVLGDTVRYSFVRDPDGNFIELSQRASLVGHL